MSFSLDGQALFDGQQVEIESSSLMRSSVERSIAGLDGVLSIDLGERCRRIKQKGSLRAVNTVGLRERIAAISAFMDGDTHTLAISSDRELDDLRMDSFNTSIERTSSSGVTVDYEIIYTQLRA